MKPKCPICNSCLTDYFMDNKWFYYCDLCLKVFLKDYTVGKYIQTDDPAILNLAKMLGIRVT